MPDRSEVEGAVRVGACEVLNASREDLLALRRSEVSMIFQDPRAGINPMRRVGDFLTESLRLNHGWGKDRARTRALELLRAVGLDDAERHLRQFPHELSGGMLQRVMIAGALTVEPSLLLCDEPTTALDVTTQAEILGILSRLQADRAMGVLFITHDLDLAAAVCDRVYVMYAGRIVESAAAGTVFGAPSHPYTAGLLASTPDLSGEQRRLVPIPGAPLSLLERPEGCAFAARCAFAVEGLCDTSVPELLDTAGHSVRCLRSPGIGPELAALRDASGGSGMSGEPLLQVTDLRKTYATGGTVVKAVDGLSFALPVGGAVGLVGESGSGKTTTARMLVGLELPDSGEILVGGQPLDLKDRGRAARLARAKAVQIVFQDPYLSLDPRIRIRDCIDAVVRLHTTLGREARAGFVTDLLHQVGLGDREADALPRRLSGGQRQRAAIARALAVSPRVLVLDEAVSALDVSVQAQVLNLLDDIRRATGVGLVFVSHDLAVVRYVCDEVLVMRRGVVVEQRPTRDVLEAPEHPYTKLLLSSVPRPGWDLDSISQLRSEVAAAGE